MKRPASGGEEMLATIQGRVSLRETYLQNKFRDTSIPTTLFRGAKPDQLALFGVLSVQELPRREALNEFQF